MKILVVEDELLIQKSLETLLRKKGANVDTASGGTEALQLINTNEYDRIVCDLMLQDITGFDVIEETKKKYALEEISNKFIIITAYSSENVLNKAEEYGCIILQKPFHNLNEALTTIMQQQGANHG